MRPLTITLLVLVVAIACIVGLSFTLFHGERLHHIHHATVQLISRADHDRFLKMGVHCEETYTTQGYEGPEAVLRMFSLTRHEFQDLNPGVPISENPAGTVLCVKGKVGDASSEAFHWFWPITGIAFILLGAAFSWFIRTRLPSSVRVGGSHSASKAQPDAASQP